MFTALSALNAAPRLTDPRGIAALCPVSVPDSGFLLTVRAGCQLIGSGPGCFVFDCICRQSRLADRRVPGILRYLDGNRRVKIVIR